MSSDVELGYHFCYGDFAHRHFKEPEDTTAFVSIANGLAEGVSRPISWLHLPVPRKRTDDKYFAPMRDLRLQPGTELYLGLIHHTDGLDGACERMRAARKVISAFGVATECGAGRRQTETIQELLQLHMDALSHLQPKVQSIVEEHVA